MPTAIEEMAGQIAQTREEIANLFKKKNSKGELDWSPDDLENYQGLDRKANDLQPKYSNLVKLQAAERKNADDLADLRKPVRPGAFGSANPDGHDESEGKQGVPASVALAKAVTESENFKRHFSSQNPVKVKLADFDSADLVNEFKTVMSTTAGFAPFSPRGNVRVPFALRRPMIGDMITQDPTQYATNISWEETTFTNNAAAVAEGAVKPESANAWTQRTVPIEVIATVLPVTDQQLEDVNGIELVIRDRLTLMIMLAEENYFLNGTGTSPQIQGLLTKTGVQSYAQGTADVNEEIADAIMRGMTLVRAVGFAEPDGIAIHPTDYQTIRLLKTTQGLYIFGDPATAGAGSIWGLKPVVTTAMTAGTALVGEFGNPLYTHVSRKKGITIDVGYVNDDFSRNQRTIRAETRVSQEVGRPAAFARITNLG